MKVGEQLESRNQTKGSEAAVHFSQSGYITILIE